mgnify:CR=1 FL=1
MYSVLIVEDEVLVREIIVDYFEKEGWQIFEAQNGREALEQYERNSIDLVILDIMLPMLDGWAVCRRLRENSAVPIIMLTAREDEDDKLFGYEVGGDDYITKPFSPRVLVAKAKALIKRSEGMILHSNLMQFGALEIDIQSHKVSIDGKVIPLSPKEYDVLLCLAKNKDTVLTRDQLLDAVWGYDFFGDNRTVDSHIKKLRSKLGEESKRIVTVIRIGYKFEGTQ